MKLSERMFGLVDMSRGDEGMIRGWADEVAQLEDENEALRDLLKKQTLWSDKAIDALLTAEVALLKDACAGALNYLNGTATKFSERNKAAVKDKLRRALGKTCTCNHSTFAGFHDADCPSVIKQKEEAMSENKYQKVKRLAMELIPEAGGVFSNYEELLDALIRIADSADRTGVVLATAVRAIRNTEE